MTVRFVHWSEVVTIDDRGDYGMSIHYRTSDRPLRKRGLMYITILPTFPRYPFIRRYIIAGKDGFPGGAMPNPTSHIEMEVIDVHKNDRGRDHEDEAGVGLIR
jgi:hypothetical protein